MFPYYKNYYKLIKRFHQFSKFNLIICGNICFNEYYTLLYLWIWRFGKMNFKDSKYIYV